MSGESSEITDAVVAEMVHHLQPAWTVQTVDRSTYGTDFVAMLEVDTPAGARRVVLKATTAEWVDPETARAEPRLLALAAERTSIPVPAVLGHCDEHEDLPAPFYLMSYVEGRNFEDERPAPPIRERILREGGRNLAELHGLDILDMDRIGRVGVRDGELTVLPSEGADGDEFHEWLLATYEETVESLAEGGQFPERADDPQRFADLVEDLQAYLRETIPELPAPNPPTVCHNDYRHGNLLVDPDTGETTAVLDWGILLSGAPAYNLATTESMLLTPNEDDPGRTAELRDLFRSAYAETREGWRFDEATRERMRVYRLTCRIDAMACLPLWYEDASPERRDERAAEHRAFVAQYL